MNLFTRCQNIGMLKSLSILFIGMGISSLGHSQKYKGSELNTGKGIFVACFEKGLTLTLEELQSTLMSTDYNGDGTLRHNGQNYTISNATNCHLPTYEGWKNIKDAIKEFNTWEESVLDRWEQEEKGIQAHIQDKYNDLRGYDQLLGEANSKFKNTIADNYKTQKEKRDQIVKSSQLSLDRTIDSLKAKNFIQMSDPQIDSVLDGKIRSLDNIITSANQKINAINSTIESYEKNKFNDLKSEMTEVFRNKKQAEEEYLKAHIKLHELEIKYLKQIVDRIQKLVKVKEAFKQSMIATSNPTEGDFSGFQKQSSSFYKNTCSFDVTIHQENEANLSCEEGSSPEVKQCHCRYDANKNSFNCRRFLLAHNLPPQEEINFEYETENVSANIWPANTTVYSNKDAKLKESGHASAPPILWKWFEDQREEGVLPENAVHVFDKIKEQNPNVNWECDQCDIKVIRHELKYDRYQGREQVLRDLSKRDVPFANFQEYEPYDPESLKLLAAKNKEFKPEETEKISTEIDRLIFESRARNDEYAHIGYLKNKGGNEEVFKENYRYALELAWFSIPTNTHIDPPEDTKELIAELKRNSSQLSIRVRAGVSFMEDSEDRKSRRLGKKWKKQDEPVFAAKDMAGRGKIGNFDKEGQGYFRSYSYDEIVVNCKTDQEIQDILEPILDEEISAQKEYDSSSDNQRKINYRKYITSINEIEKDYSPQKIETAESKIIQKEEEISTIDSRYQDEMNKIRESSRGNSQEVLGWKVNETVRLRIGQLKEEIDRLKEEERQRKERERFKRQKELERQRRQKEADKKKKLGRDGSEGKPSKKSKDKDKDRDKNTSGDGDNSTRTIKTTQSEPRGRPGTNKTTTTRKTKSKDVKPGKGSLSSGGSPGGAGNIGSGDGDGKSKPKKPITIKEKKEKDNKEKAKKPKKKKVKKKKKKEPKDKKKKEKKPKKVKPEKPKKVREPKEKKKKKEKPAKPEKEKKQKKERTKKDKPKKEKKEKTRTRKKREKSPDKDSEQDKDRSSSKKKTPAREGSPGDHSFEIDKGDKTPRRVEKAITPPEKKIEEIYTPPVTAAPPETTSRRSKKRLDIENTPPKKGQATRTKRKETPENNKVPIEKTKKEVPRIEVKEEGISPNPSSKEVCEEEIEEEEIKKKRKPNDRGFTIDIEIPKKDKPKPGRKKRSRFRKSKPANGKYKPGKCPKPPRSRKK